MILNELRKGKVGDRVTVYNHKGLKIDGRLKELTHTHVTFVNVWIDDDPTIEFEMRIKIKDIAHVEFVDKVETGDIDENIEVLKSVLDEIDNKVRKKKKIRFVHKIANEFIRILIMVILSIDKILKRIFDDMPDQKDGNGPFDGSEGLLE